MRILRSRIVSLLVVTALLMGVVAASGCKTTTPARISYNTIDGAVEGVQTAMRAFNSRYQTGLQSEAERTKVLAAYDIFQASARLATVAARDVSQHQKAVTVAIDAAADLILLIDVLTPKGKP